jgi:hypothetical protein
MAPPSSPFVSRELNGAVLVESLQELRDAQVPSRHLVDLVAGLRALSGARVAEAAVTLRALAQQRFAGQPAVASLLMRWGARLKVEADVPLLIGHLERLAIAFVLIPALRQANEADRK